MSVVHVMHHVYHFIYKSLLYLDTIINHEFYYLSSLKTYLAHILPNGVTVSPMPHISLASPFLYDIVRKWPVSSAPL